MILCIASNWDHTKPYKVTFNVNGEQLFMEIDMGTSISVVGKEMFDLD